MKIRWLGHATFDINNKVDLITDPHDESLGVLPENLSADIVTISHKHEDHNYTKNIKRNPKIIDKLGSYDVSGIKINGIPSFHDNAQGVIRGKNIIYTIKIENITICHLGDLGHLLTKDQIKDIGNIDILMIPVGGIYTIDASDAVEVVHQLKPKIIIPMHYKPRNYNSFPFPLDTVDKFIELLGWDILKTDEVEINDLNINTFENKVIDFDV